jgi:DNA-binding response OmpR family regulator
MTGKVKILIVEDEPGVAMTMRFILGRANCEAQIAGTKERAIKMAESGNFDLITLDVNLKGDNGFEICRYLKQNPRLRNIPIVMVSGLCSLKDQQQGLDVGAADYITKPFDSTEFVARILSHIETEVSGTGTK